MKAGFSAEMLQCGLQLKNVLMAAYFAADHVVWAGQAGILTDKDVLAR